MLSFVSVVFILLFQNIGCLDGQTSENSRLNFFDIDLLRYTAEDRSGNVMISPASIKSTLAMILEGAIGPTADDIRNALRLSPNKEEFREQLNLYLKALQANKSESLLQNKNAVFVSNKLKMRKTYEMMLRGVYLADVCRIDFKDPVLAADFINGWVSNVTKGLIPSIVEPVNINPSTDILLTNALYFKSTWKHSFNPRNTRGACFYNRGVCRNVAMMELHAELNYAYVNNLRAHAVELPYKGERYSMVIVVPQDREGLSILIRDLPYMSLSQISKLFEPVDVMLSFPKFDIDYSEDMVPSLRAMRITNLFSPHSNLSGVFEGDSPQINSIFHRVHMKVDEAGTVAAAATVAMVIPLIENGVHLRVDRPFVFFIKDNKLGITLFEGKIEEPTSYVDQNKLNGLSTKKNERNLSDKRSYG